MVSGIYVPMADPCLHSNLGARLEFARCEYSVHGFQVSVCVVLDVNKSFLTKCLMSAPVYLGELYF